MLAGPAPAEQVSTRVRRAAPSVTVRSSSPRRAVKSAIGTENATAPRTRLSASRTGADTQASSGWNSSTSRASPECLTWSSSRLRSASRTRVRSVSLGMPVPSR